MLGRDKVLASMSVDGAMALAPKDDGSDVRKIVDTLKLHLHEEFFSKSNSRHALSQVFWTADPTVELPVRVSRSIFHLATLPLSSF